MGGYIGGEREGEKWRRERRRGRRNVKGRREGVCKGGNVKRD